MEQKKLHIKIHRFYFQSLVQILCLNKQTHHIWKRQKKKTTTIKTGIILKYTQIKTNMENKKPMKTLVYYKCE